jgi:hypothetical protein
LLESQTGKRSAQSEPQANRWKMNCKQLNWKEMMLNESEAEEIDGGPSFRRKRLGGYLLSS